EALHQDIGEIRAQLHAALPAQRRTRDLIARPALRQCRLRVDSSQQETQLVAWQFAVHQCRKLFANRVVDHGLAHTSDTSPPSSNGRNFWSIASRARKMRERTVPIGQFIASAISS